MRLRRSPRAQRGYSIIEIVTAVAVLALLLGFAIPSFEQFMMNFRTTSQTNDLLADFAVARYEATKLGRNVTVAANGGDWNTGWQVNSDLNGNGTIAAEEILRQRGDLVDGFAVAASDSGGTAITQIVFGPTGAMTAPAAVAEFAICRPDNDTAKARGVRVQQTGRAESKKGLSGFTVSCP
jgi:type IV fimbrial biogenesis protein FimT